MLRLGAVSYLNTKPLITGLADRLGDEGHLRLDLPSRLAADLAAGKLDVALIPSIEYFRGDNYQIVSDAVIGCRGPVWSVRLLSRVPMGQIQTLAFDEGSRTSAALTRVLLSEMHGVTPQPVAFPISDSPETIDADAILVIGDRAMHPAKGVYKEIWDLGDRWCRWTELPFVFAMWVARPGFARTQELASVLQQSRDQGLETLEQIAATESASHGLTKEELHRYFTENLHFTMGPGERRGLDEFRRRALQIGLLESPLSDSTTQDVNRTKT